MVRTNFFAIGRTTAVSPTILNKDAKFRDGTVRKKRDPHQTETCVLDMTELKIEDKIP